jgi:hypothetical protein
VLITPSSWGFVTSQISNQWRRRNSNTQNLEPTKTLNCI